MKESAEILLEKAGRNLKVAESNLSMGDPDFIEDICYNCQQAVEKYLKAFIAYNNKEYKKNHDLGELLENCEAIDPSFSELDKYKFNFNTLTDYAVDLRYEALMPSMEDAKEAVSIAEHIKPFVLNKIKDISVDKTHEKELNDKGPDLDIDF